MRELDVSLEELDVCLEGGERELDVSQEGAGTTFPLFIYFLLKRITVTR
jgi:hypothetical protein